MNLQVRRLAALCLAAALLLALPVQAAPSVSGEKAILMDADTGTILYEKQAQSRALIASTTKIMTALVVCEQGNLDRQVKVPPQAVGIEGSSMYLRAEETLQIRDLLYGLMLHSGNDAAVALSILCAGSEANFVQKMNETARDLGLQDTHYANASGLDDAENYSTALDLAKLSAHALENADFLELVCCKYRTVGERCLRNHNKMLFRYAGAIGVKTGYTKAAGRILVSAAERDGRRLIAVTLRAPDDWNDHTAMLDYGFSCYTPRVLVRSGQRLGALPVAGGVQDMVELEADSDFTFPLLDEETCQIALRVPKFCYAPTVPGAYAGQADILLADRCIGTIKLRYAAAVEAQKREKRWYERMLGGR